MDYLSAFVDNLKRLRADATRQDWTLPEPPELPPVFSSNRLQWRAAQTLTKDEPITIEQLREKMPAVMREHIIRQRGEILLMKIAAGGGKTYSGVDVAQWAAQNGYRVLWAASRHAMYEDLERLPHFDRKLWYHWLPIRMATGDDDPVPTTCLYAPAQKKWANKGYDSYSLCTQLCALSGHIKKCTYRLQQKRKERIIFCMHEHLSSGISINDFDVVIVDELPLKAFIEQRTIPASGIELPSAVGPIKELLGVLVSLAHDFQRRIFSGKSLFDHIGPLLADVYAQVDHLPHMVPLIPIVQSVDRIDELPYWYIFQLLEVASAEYDAWRNGWESWQERIRVDALGIHIDIRSAPWAHLPQSMIVLDATASAGMYRQIFGREIEEYHPVIRRKGRIYQVVGRLNGISSFLDRHDKSLRQSAQDAMTITKQIASRYTGRVGIICNLAMRPYFERDFGEANVAHFHNLRGTNSLEDVECLVVVGNPSPRLPDVLRAAAALNDQRIRPYGEKNEHGHTQPLFFDQDREYSINDELRQSHGDKTPWRSVKGYWSEPELQDIYDAFREAEIVQALHRARPNARECDVWVLTSTPTSEPLNGIWDDPPLGPDVIHWKQWLKLEPWLDDMYERGETVTMDNMSEFLQIGRDWIKRNKWLDAIAAYQPERWETCLLPTGKRGGRPSTGIKPFILPDH